MTTTKERKTEWKGRVYKTKSFTTVSETNAFLDTNEAWGLLFGKRDTSEWHVARNTDMGQPIPQMQPALFDIA